jgi:hypothetical protein
LNGAGSSSAQRGAGVAAQVVIQGSVPAALAPAVGAAAARASIPTVSHVLANPAMPVDASSWRRGRLDVPNLQPFTQKSSEFLRDNFYA